jgi:methylenetetrahydrofolate reductase (NADPH)
MNLSALYGRGGVGISFEVFPPKTLEGDAALMGAVRDLVSFGPSFISCTFGAGGSTRDQTLDLICRIRDAFQVEVVAHRTCVESSVGEIRTWLKRACDLGVENVVALRGDPPRGTAVFQPARDGLAHASELVELMRREFPHLGIAVAGYPETHREAESPEADLLNLKRKVDAGADLVLTQLFYDNADFFDFRRRYQAAGIQAPLVPGILPVTSFAQVERITALCGARIPAALRIELEAHRDDPEGQAAAGVAYAIRQCQALVKAGVPGLHFYVLNKAEAPGKILRALQFPRA